MYRHVNEFLSKQKSTEAEIYLCINYEQQSKLEVQLEKMTLTSLGVFLASHSDHLSQGKGQAYCNPREKWETHVCMSDMQRPHKQWLQSRRGSPRESPAPSYSVQAGKSKCPRVQQAPGRAITANWNKVPPQPPTTSSPRPPCYFQPSSLPLICSLIISSFISRPTFSWDVCSCLERLD